MCVNIAVKPQAPDKAPASSGGSSFNQLLGIKGAAQESVSTKCSFSSFCEIIY